MSKTVSTILTADMILVLASLVTLITFCIGDPIVFSGDGFAPASTMTFPGMVYSDSCLGAGPNDTYSSSSPFADILLRAVISKPGLRSVFDVDFDPVDVRDAVFNTLKNQGGIGNDPKSLSFVKSIGGSLSLLVRSAYPRITNVVNGIAITNALADFLKSKIVVTPENAERIANINVMAIQRAMSNDDGTPYSRALVPVDALFNFLADTGALKPNNLHELIARMAGRYYEAIYTTKCKPSSFEEVLSQEPSV